MLANVGIADFVDVCCFNRGLLGFCRRSYIWCAGEGSVVDLQGNFH